MPKLMENQLYWIQTKESCRLGKKIQPALFIETDKGNSRFLLIGSDSIVSASWVGNAVTIPSKQLKQCAGKRGRDDNKCYTCKWYTNSPTDIIVNAEICALIKPYWSQWEPK